MTIKIDEIKFKEYSDTEDSVIADFEQFYELFRRIIDLNDNLQGVNTAISNKILSIARECEEQVEWMEFYLT